MGIKRRSVSAVAAVMLIVGSFCVGELVLAEETVGMRGTPSFPSLPPEKKRDIAKGMATDDSGDVQSRKVPKFKPGKEVQSRGLFSKKKKKEKERGGGAAARSQPPEQTDPPTQDGLGAGR